MANVQQNAFPPKRDSINTSAFACNIPKSSLQKTCETVFCTLTHAEQINKMNSINYRTQTTFTPAKKKIVKNLEATPQETRKGESHAFHKTS